MNRIIVACFLFLLVSPVWAEDLIEPYFNEDDEIEYLIPGHNGTKIKEDGSVLIPLRNQQDNYGDTYLDGDDIETYRELN